MNIIEKIKESGLLGRSGSGFPTGLKWEMVKKARSPKKYIICNASEGEPNVFKDKFILKNYPEEVINGIKIALNTIDNSSAYIYINKNYYKLFGKSLKKLSKGLDITFFEKPSGYIAGEETSAIEAIEGNRPEPRTKPPFPTEVGLFGCPTLVNNVETFYYVSKISKNQYQGERFYSITGDVRQGVYELPEKYTILQVLKQANSLPDFDFFLQVGGGACGEILLKQEINQPLRGLGSIIVFDRKKTDLFALMEKWIDFLLKGNCDKCTPCREGLFRLKEILAEKRIDQKIFEEIFFVLENTSFCPLGKGAITSFKTLIKKCLKKQ